MGLVASGVVATTALIMWSWAVWSMVAKLLMSIGVDGLVLPNGGEGGEEWSLVDDISHTGSVAIMHG